MATVIFPPQFTSVLQGQLTHVSSGKTVAEVLQNICLQKAALKKLLFLDNGAVTPYLVFTLIGEDKIYSAANASVRSVEPDQTIEILVGIAGG